MSVTRQEPAEGGDRGRTAPREEAAVRQAGQEKRRAMPFDEFLRTLYPAAKARNDSEWLEWYEGWLKGMPEEGREAYMERSKADYERRIGMTIDECMHQRQKAHIAKCRAERIKRNFEDATNHQIMVENMRIFEREYFAMTARRSC